MEFRLLGPLEALSDGRPLPIGGQKQRGVLALLLLHANEVVSTDRLIDEVWGARPPKTRRCVAPELHLAPPQTSSAAKRSRRARRATG